GLSGVGIRPLGLRSVKRVREAIGQGPVLIGMGGICTADDVRQFQSAGADLIGIGSALTGMDSREMRHYFQALERGLRPSAIPAKPATLPQITMDYSP